MALLSLPFWLFRRLAQGRYAGQFRERMGRLPPAVAARFGERPAVWVHAASAGETASAAPLVRELKKLLPGRPFFFTITSRYGKEMAQRRLGGVVDGIAYSPLDLPLFARRVLDIVRPALYVMVETDLWPNLVRQARRRGARVAIASGHAGPRGFPRPFWRAVFGNVDLLLMQTALDADHIRRRGAPAARVHVLGNLKYDGVSAMPPADVPAWRAALAIPVDVPVFVAGSTLAEDEGPVLDAIATLRAEGIDLHGIVAPRRQERVAAVVEGCQRRRLDAVRRTDGGGAKVLILDTMGELARAYDVADVAYVGGGLTPEVGLHNLLEPLVCGVPVLQGPHRGKARRIAEELARAGAAVEVADGAELLDALRGILTDGERKRRLVEAGRAVLDRHRGAAVRQAGKIAELLA